MLIFSVTLYQNETQNHSIDKVQNRVWEKKEGIYAKTFTKIQVTAIFLKRDMYLYEY